ncbi:hypothetical protein N801_10070 [Knoellia aerolata DSM 18566]|uniref:N-acetyltransferase domain-containing protein n=1 Tax=Knoellia aerolata DSM 18566 TaxID=1385519 RepID=A0A0A0JXX8_9MICO|nr:hypothetical protein N801_10070 [Knoellia aerolata DSM 18566]
MRRHHPAQRREPRAARALGFETVGTYRRIGWKHGRWRDVTWVQKPLGGDGPPTAESQGQGQGLG